MPRDDDFDGVGYKRPPLHSRFRKGQSGNPSGRRKGRPRLGLIEELDKLLGEPIKVARNGRQESISFVAALLKKTAEAALKGDAKARQTMFALLAQYEQSMGSGTAILTNDQEEALIADYVARRSKAGGGDG